MSISERGQHFSVATALPRGATADLQTAARPASSRAMAPAVSVVLPVHNEAACIDRTITESLHWARTRLDYEFIFVDDGSTDDTPNRLAAQLSDQPQAQLRYLTAPRNGGKGAAMRLGFAHCHGRLIIYTDGDLAYSLDHLPVVAEALGDFEVVIGSRKLPEALDADGPSPGWLRATLGEGFNRLSRYLVGLPYRDTQAGLKGFRYEAATRLFPRLRTDGYAVDVELLYLAQRLGYSIGQVPARVSAGHRSVPSSVDLVRDPLRMAWDMGRIRLGGWLGRYD
jgi:glycosyltransferase involved in cell wall biosynthesis